MPWTVNWPARAPTSAGPAGHRAIDPDRRRPLRGPRQPPCCLVNSVITGWLPPGSGRHDGHATITQPSGNNRDCSTELTRGAAKCVSSRPASVWSAHASEGTRRCPEFGAGRLKADANGRRATLSELVGHPIRGFAYPFGSRDALCQAGCPRYEMRVVRISLHGAYGRYGDSQISSWPKRHLNQVGGEVHL
jgi:hypothetical protein